MNDKGNIKLDDIGKKNVFTVPAGYFDTLPQIIQAKAVPSTRRLTALPRLLKWVAAPVLIVVVSLFVWHDFNDAASYSVEELLAQVSTEDIVDYLQADGIALLDILENIDLNDELNLEIPDMWMEGFSDKELHQLLNNYDYDTSIQYF